eukprot:scpid100915/ scgid26864/ 
MTTLFSCEATDRWKQCLKSYGSVIKALSDKKIESAAKAKKPKPNPTLLQLDNWYQNDLPGAVCSRSPAHVTHAEMAKLMQWKLTRGKFRPRLAQLIQENTSESIETCTRDAFTAYDKDKDLAAAIQKLSSLKAVGPATASAVMACRFPESCPFMADESVTGAMPGIAIQYTHKGYMAYASKVTFKARRLRAQDKSHRWTAHDVELALWTDSLAKTLGVELESAGDDDSTAGSKDSAAAAAAA